MTRRSGTPDLVSEQLSADHDLSRFDSGRPELDAWLRSSALHSDGRGITRTFVWHRGDGAVVAYYALMPYLIERGTLTGRQARGLPEAIPAYLLARLALHDDAALRGRGLGSVLLAEALARAVAAAADVGGRFVVVDALDESARDFYRHHGFEPLAGAPGRLVIRVKDIAAAIGR